MTKETQGIKTILAEGLFEALEALYAFDGTASPDLSVMSVVNGYMLAWQKQNDEEVAPAKPKQRRARRKKTEPPAINNPGSYYEGVTNA
jgi:hypothetical protein